MAPTPASRFPRSPRRWRIASRDFGWGACTAFVTSTVDELVDGAQNASKTAASRGATERRTPQRAPERANRWTQTASSTGADRHGAHEGGPGRTRSLVGKAVLPKSRKHSAVWRILAREDADPLDEALGDTQNLLTDRRGYRLRSSAVSRRAREKARSRAGRLVREPPLARPAWSHHRRRSCPSARDAALCDHVCRRAPPCESEPPPFDAASARSRETRSLA